MSMSTEVKGVVDTGAHTGFDRMKAAEEACRKAGVPIPEEVVEYFGKLGITEPEYELKHGLERDIPHKEWNDGDYRWGIEVEVSEIPDDVKTIRFYNAN